MRSDSYLYRKDIMKKYLSNLHYRHAWRQMGAKPLNRIEYIIMLCDYWLTPFKACDKWTVNNLYYGYSELFLINGIALGKYKEIIKK